jgi:hypothetical protein
LEFLVQDDVLKWLSERVEAQRVAEGVVVVEALIWSQFGQVAAEQDLFNILPYWSACCEFSCHVFPLF